MFVEKRKYNNSKSKIKISFIGFQLTWFVLNGRLGSTLVDYLLRACVLGHRLKSRQDQE